MRSGRRTRGGWQDPASSPDLDDPSESLRVVQTDQGEDNPEELPEDLPIQLAVGAVGVGGVGVEQGSPAGGHELLTVDWLEANPGQAPPEPFNPRTYRGPVDHELYEAYKQAWLD